MDEKDAVLFDLETNEVLAGNYFKCHCRLIDPIIALLKHGFEISDCQLRDTYHIYLKESGVSVPVAEGQDVRDVIEQIKLEGAQKNEYRRISYVGPHSVQYDSFTASSKIQIHFSKKYDFPNLPEGFEILPSGEGMILQIQMGEMMQWDEFRMLDVWSSVEALNQWIESITGEKVERVETPQNAYGNTYFAVDPERGEVVQGNYVEIDPYMVPTIRSLREKGYDTRGCCSGHFESVFIQDAGIVPQESKLPDSTSTWIVFRSGKAPSTFPEGWEFDPVGEYIRLSYNHPLKGTNGVYKSIDLLEQDIIEANLQLEEWAKQIPYVHADDKGDMK